MADIIQVRRDTDENWTSVNPTLAEGEMGLNQTYNYIKVGDAVTAWLDLPIAFSSVGTGAKSSAGSAGSYGQISMTDDYIYFCVQGGTVGNAIWKKSVMFTT